MTPWPYAAVEEPNPWRQEDVSPPDPAHPFAIGIDPALLGAPVPSTATRMSSVVVSPLPSKSDQQVLVITRNPTECPNPTAPSLVTSNDTVIGSALWERTTATGSVDTRGWAIVPKADPLTYRVYCSAS